MKLENQSYTYKQALARWVITMFPKLKRLTTRVNTILNYYVSIYIIANKVRELWLTSNSILSNSKFIVKEITIRFLIFGD